MRKYKLQAAAVMAVIIAVSIFSSLSYAQQSYAPTAPPLDPVLKGFKEQGVWYFMCAAPYHPVRIPPQYLSFGPPPPCAPIQGTPSDRNGARMMPYRPVSPYKMIESDGK